MLRRLVASLACLATLGVLLVSPTAHATTPDVPRAPDASPASADPPAEGADDPADGGAEGSDGTDGADRTNGSGWVTDPGDGSTGARGGHWAIPPDPAYTVDEHGALQFSAIFQQGTVSGGPVHFERWPDTATIPNPVCEGDTVNGRWEHGRIPALERHTGLNAGPKLLTYSLGSDFLAPSAAGRYRLHAHTGLGVAVERNYTCFSISVRLRAPVVLTNPTTVVTVDERGTATFTSTAIHPFPGGDIAPTVQWQRSTNNGASWTDIAGARSPVYSVSNVDADMHGHRFRAVWQRVGTNRWQLSSGAEPSTPTTLHVRAAPRIEVGPVGATVNPGQAATFSVTATGHDLRYQWQRSTDGGASWHDLQSQTGPSMTTSLATTDMNGYRYRVRVDNAVGPADTSGAALLTVRIPPFIDREPQDRTVPRGQTATFAVVAGGTGPFSYQWQRSTDGGASWHDLPGQHDSSTTTGVVEEGMHGDRYRVVVTNATGTPATSIAATLRVGTAPGIATDPDDVAVRIGDEATFAVGPTGDPAPTVQWQRSTNGGTSWSNLAGQTGASLTTSPTNALMNGYQYRAVVQNRNGGPVTSRVATLRVDPQVPRVGEHPTDLVREPGQSAEFTVTIDNPVGADHPTVHWEESTNGGLWTPIPEATGLSYTIPSVFADLNGRLFRAVLTNSIQESVASEAARLTVEQAPVVLLHPTSRTVQEGATVWFDAAVRGVPAPTREWWTAPAGSDEWQPIPGATGTRLQITAEDELHGHRYRAVFSNGVGAPVETDPATLTVHTAPRVVTEPDDARVRIGDQATFEVEVGGRPEPAVRWQWSSNGGATWTDSNEPSASTPTFTTPSRAAGDDGRLYRAALTNQGVDGVTRTTHTRDALLTVDPQVPRFRTHPVSTAVGPGEEATFTATVDNPVGAGGDTLQAHWEYSDDGTTWATVAGATDLTLTIPDVSAEIDGRRYRAVLTNTVPESVASDPATLRVVLPPTIDQDPEDAAVPRGTAAEFAVQASATGELGYQWQRRLTADSAWEDLTTQRSASMTTSPATDEMHGYQYRVVVSNTIEGVTATRTSEHATLRVGAAPAIVREPEDQLVRYNYAATFSVEVAGDPAPTIQWEWSSNGGSTWTDSTEPSATSVEFRTPVRFWNHSGYQYRARVENRVGGPVYSRVATLVVYPEVPVFGVHPQDRTVAPGADATFSATLGNPVGAHAESVRAHWEQSADGGDTWHRVAGADDLELTVASVAVGDSGQMYRAVLTNRVDESATSLPATLTVGQAPVVTQEPIEQEVRSGERATFSVDGTGDPEPTIRWEVSTDGTTWSATDEPSSASREFTTPVLRLDDDGRQYRAVLSNIHGTVESDAVAVRVRPALPAITEHPADRTAFAGWSAAFAVAVGNAQDLGTTTVRWLWSDDGPDGIWHVVDGADGWTLRLPATATVDGRLVRAEVSNRDGEITASDPATLTVREALRFPVTLTPRVVLVDRLPAREATP